MVRFVDLEGVRAALRPYPAAPPSRPGFERCLREGLVGRAGRRCLRRFEKRVSYHRWRLVNVVAISRLAMTVFSPMSDMSSILTDDELAMVNRALERSVDRCATTNIGRWR
jgi:hypothetical protein